MDLTFRGITFPVNIRMPTTSDQGRVPLRNLEHDPEKWEPVFGKRSCSNKKLDHDPGST
jgi:hypothetical protein